MEQDCPQSTEAQLRVHLDLTAAFTVCTLGFYPPALNRFLFSQEGMSFIYSHLREGGTCWICISYKCPGLPGAQILRPHLHKYFMQKWNMVREAWWSGRGYS